MTKKRTIMERCPAEGCFNLKPQGFNDCGWFPFAWFMFGGCNTHYNVERAEAYIRKQLFVKHIDPYETMEGK